MDKSQSGKFKIQYASPNSYERLVAEIYWDDFAIFDIVEEGGPFEFEVEMKVTNSAGVTKQVRLPFQELKDVMEQAKRGLHRSTERETE